MNRALVVLAVVSLAGCAWSENRTDIAGQPFSYRIGSGVVESVTPAPTPFMAAPQRAAPRRRPSSIASRSAWTTAGCNTSTPRARSSRAAPSCGSGMSG